MNRFLLLGIISASFGFLASYLIVWRLLRKFSVLKLLLVLLLLSLTTIVIVNALVVSSYLMKFPHFFRLGIPAGFCIGPLGYLYIKKFISGNDKASLKDGMHFIPFLLVVIDLTPLLVKSAEEKRLILEQYVNNVNYMLTWNEGTILSEYLTWIAGFHVLVYMFLSSYLIYQGFHQHAKIHRIALTWLCSIVLCIGMIAILYLWSVAIKTEYTFAYDVFMVFSTTVYIAFIFMLYHRPDILYGLTVETSDKRKREQLNKYQPLASEQVQEYLSLLQKYIEDEKPYLKRGYSMDDMANSLNLDRRLLSVVINEGLGMRYNDLMNKTRIEHLVRHFPDINSKNLTLEGMATSVGFNSRITFSNFIKKFTGLTPSEFIRSLENNEAIEYRNLR